jgi:hypothetical protein
MYNLRMSSLCPGSEGILQAKECTAASSHGSSAARKWVLMKLTYEPVQSVLHGSIGADNERRVAI